MPRYLALLRGINVGGRNPVAMADLRRLAASLGLADVATYIQSGNLVFTSGSEDGRGLAAALERSLATELGVRAAVVVISAGELAQAIADNPFPAETNTKLLHAVFRDTDPSAADRARITEAVHRARQQGSADDAILVGRTLYLHVPEGFGRSELAARLTAASAATAAAGTTRNWATVTRLMAMLTDAE
jgi:uncharacterized protein (DUF1697 family)